MLHSLPEYPQSSGSSPHGGLRTAGLFPHFPVPVDTSIRQAFRSGFPMRRQGLPSCCLPTSIYMLHSLPEYPQRPGSSPHEGLRAAGLFPSFFRPRRYLHPAGFPFRLPHEATGTSSVLPPHQSKVFGEDGGGLEGEGGPFFRKGLLPPPIPANPYPFPLAFQLHTPATAHRANAARSVLRPGSMARKAATSSRPRMT